SARSRPTGSSRSFGRRRARSSATRGRIFCRARATSPPIGCRRSRAATTTSRPGSARVRTTTDEARGVAGQGRPAAPIGTGTKQKISIAHPRRTGRSAFAFRLVLLAFCVLAQWSTALAAADDFEGALAALAAARSFPEKTAAARAVAATGHPRAAEVLAAMLDGALYLRRGDGRLAIAAAVPEGFALRDAATGDDLGTVGRRDVERVGVNNALRTALRELLAALKLDHDDPRERIAAIEEVARSGDAALLPTLTAMLETETHGGARGRAGRRRGPAPAAAGDARDPAARRRAPRARGGDRAARFAERGSRDAARRDRAREPTDGPARAHRAARARRGLRGRRDGA